MRVLAAQINPVIGDVRGNTEKVLEALAYAREHGVDIVCFPEMTLCGYAPEDLVLLKGFVEEMEGALERVVAASRGVAALVGLIRKNPVREEKGLLNSAAVIEDGRLLGFHDKWLLPTYDVFDERRYFARSKKIQVWEVRGKRIGVLICEDMWQNAGEAVSGTSYPWDPVKALQPLRPELLFNLTASPFQSRRADIRVEVCRAAAATLHCPVVYTCQVGANGAVIFDGYSLFVGADGTLRQVGAGFREDYMVIDTEKPGVATFTHDPMEDIFSALQLGVSDYFAKSGQTRAIVGLTGGVDAAVVAAIATSALGKENVMGIYLPTAKGSPETLEDARALARNLGIVFHEIAIEEVMSVLRKTLEPHLPGVLPEENIEDRVRGLILMTFANVLRALTLCTGNKSELALGYCTLYGDMCGAISVIGDVLKTECYALARWINREREVIPKRTLSKESTMPHHERVDAIIRAYVEEYQSIAEIAQKQGVDEGEVRAVVLRIYKAEHKRRQAAPSLRISKKSFAAGRRKPLHFRGSLSEQVY